MSEEKVIELQKRLDRMSLALAILTALTAVIIIFVVVVPSLSNWGFFDYVKQFCAANVDVKSLTTELLLAFFIGCGGLIYHLVRKFVIRQKGDGEG